MIPSSEYFLSMDSSMPFLISPRIHSSMLVRMQNLLVAFQYRGFPSYNPSILYNPLAATVPAPVTLIAACAPPVGAV